MSPTGCRFGGAVRRHRHCTSLQGLRGTGIARRVPVDTVFERGRAPRPDGRRRLLDNGCRRGRRPGVHHGRCLVQLAAALLGLAGRRRLVPVLVQVGLVTRVFYGRAATHTR